MAMLGSLLWDGLAAFAVFIFVVYLYATAEFDYFKKCGIPYERPLPLVGSFLSVTTGKDSMMSACVPMYQKFKKNKFGGLFMGNTPGLLVCDPELVKTVLTKDFSSLRDRGIPHDEENDPLSGNLVNMGGNRWKSLRSKLTPTFTSGKLKMMFPLIKECSNELTDFLRESAAKGEDIELTQILVRYCTDVIGTCAFGVSCNSIKNPDSEFYQMGRAIFRSSIFSAIRFAIGSSKLLSKLMPFKWFFPGAENFFIDLMKNTVNFRKENNVERNDFVQLMMQLLQNDESKSPKDHPDEVVFTVNVMAAQAFVFFVAGLDSIANTVALAIYHMCLNPRIQEELADEVVSVIRNHDGELTYETLKEMDLLERVISESLRMYTAGGVVFREVSAPSYTLPGSGVTLKKGMKVVIPVQGIHYDPDIYPEPHKFDPDRFTEDAVNRRHPYTYLPFGEGPRVCIATRLALLECKLCLASLIKVFKFSVCPETQIPVVIDPLSLFPAPKGGIFLKIEMRSYL